MGKKITISVRSLVTFTLLIAIVVSAFYFAPVSEAGVETFNITNQERTITAGQSFQIKLNGIKASKVKWKSNNTSVATVSKKGIVKGVGKGKTVVKGTYNGLVFNITVNVNAKLKNIIYTEETAFKILKPKRIIEDYGVEFLNIGGLFTNNSSTPRCFNSFYYFEVYVNNVEKNGYDKSLVCPGIHTNVKNGASIECYCSIDVSKGDKVEVTIYKYSHDREVADQVVYKTTYNVK